MKKILMFLWFHFLCVSFIYSQDSSEKKHHLLLKAGGSFPTVGTFSDEEGLVDPLDILTGFNIGIRYQYLLTPMKPEKAYFLINLGADYILNPEENSEDRLAEGLSSEFSVDVDVDHKGDFTYLNIPVLFGLTAGFQIDESVDVFATLEGGLSFFNLLYPEETVVKVNQERSFIITPNEVEGLIKPCLSIHRGRH